MLQWRIHYDDGSTYSDQDGPPELAPVDGVVVVARIDVDVGRELLHLKDYYYWERDRWWGCDLFGMWDYLRRPGWKKVIAGRNTEHANYSAIFERARLDPDLPAKSARLPGEAPLRV